MSLRMSSRAYGRVRFAQLAVLAIVLSAIAFALPSSAAAEPLCTDTWTGAAEGNWSTVTNWSAGHAPSSSDVACIGAGKVAVVSSGSNTAAVVQGAGGVSVSGGTLTVVSALEASSIASLRVSGGTLGGAASISVSSSFVWSEAGTLAGKGQTIIASGASATLEGTTCSSLFLVERKLLNEGSATFTGTNIRMSEGAVLENKGTFTANSESSCVKYAFINEGGTVAPKIVNSGTLRKTSGSGSTIEAVALENHGTVEAATGKLVLHGGGNANASGTFIGATGAVLQFAEGAFALAASTWKGQIELANPGATVSTEGLLGTAATVVQTTGTWLLSGSSTTVESFSLISGELAGAGTLVVAKSFLWESGTMAGAGKTVVGSGATGAIEGPSCGTAFLIKRTFENAGTLTFKGEMLRMQEAALFENTGVFRANSESTCLKYAIISEPVPSEPHKESLPGESAFVNVGTFEKTEGTGTTIVEAPFEAFGSPPVAHTGKFEFIKPFTRELSASYGGAESLEPGQTCSCAGEPVLVTGDFLERQSDLSVGGRGVGLEFTRTYNSQAAAEGAKGTFGYGWSNSFSEKLVIDKEHHLATFYRAGGGTVAFKESGGTYTPPATSRYSLAGSTEAGYTLTAPDQTVYKFSGTSGRLESITDRNGNATTLAYGGTGRLETITDPVGRKLTLAYNAEGLVETAKDPMGHTVKYTYEGGNLATVTEPGEATARWSFKYDGSHQATEMIDGRGGVLVNEYNAAHQVIKQTDPLKHVTKFTYAPFNVRVLNESTGSETSESYTSNFESASTTNGYGTAIATTTLRTYNAGGYLTSETDGNGHTTKYGYNAANDRTSETDPEGDETKWEYNAAHFVVSTTTPKGETTTIERDAHGNALKVSRPAPASKTQATKYKYTAHGELELATELLEPGERTTTYEYNSHGDRTAEIDPEKDKRTWGYNEDSFETSMVSPNGHVEGAKESKFTTTITRDEQNRATLVTGAPQTRNEIRLRRQRRPRIGHRPRTATKPSTPTTPTTSSRKSKRRAVTVSETEYDGAGQRDQPRLTATNTRRNTSATSSARSTEVIDPLARKTTKEYDAAGNLKAVTDAKARTTTYTYDTANRLTKIVYSDGKTPERQVRIRQRLLRAPR